MQTQTKVSKNTSFTQINTSTRRHLIIPLLMVCFFSFLAERAESKGYYKWVDQNGKTQYTETPPPAEAQKSAAPTHVEPKQDKKSLRDRVAAENEGSKTENSHSKKSSSDSNQKTAAPKKIETQATPASAKTNPDANSEQQKKEKPYEELKAEFIKKSCEKAEQNLQSMTNHGRVKMVKDNGEEHFLSAEEKNKKMAETNQFIGTNCKTMTKGKKKQ